jgi:hypothetical protein
MPTPLTRPPLATRRLRAQAPNVERGASATRSCDGHNPFTGATSITIKGKASHLAADRALEALKQIEP